MKTRFLALAASAFALLGTALHAQTSTWTIDPAHSSIEFQVRHLGVSNVHGSINGVKGTVLLDEKEIAKSSVNATMDATTVTTNNDARDKHIKSPDFFDVTKYPQLTFKSTSFTHNNGKLQMTGELTLAGVTKPLTLDVDGPSAPQKGMGGKTVSGFSATGTLNRSDFNFGPKFPSPMIGDDVKFTVDIEMDKQ